MTNNQLSRKVLELLFEQKKPVKFRALAEAIQVDVRTLFKNLFYLEEHDTVTLSTSYPTDAVFPQILFARLTDAGRDLAGNSARLEELFPLADTTRDHAPHLPPDLPAPRKKTSYAAVLGQLAEEVKASTRDP
ncbi:MAG: hypothetical protein O8C63_12780, partial [Candidatus Methanoperedens sp.]|nr:hypothetical protein [Candidatus Methanoperedens sp.]